MLYFAHISDTHIGPTKDSVVRGVNTFAQTERLVATLNALPQRPDFVIHTGDVVNGRDSAEFSLAAHLFAALDMPIYFVAGNHDTADGIRQFLPFGKYDALTDDKLCYTFTIKGRQFLVLDGSGPDDILPHGHLSPEQLAIVEQLATPAGPPLTVFIHYPSWPLNSIWMDAHMLLLNGPELHAALLPARDRLIGVFHGHVHQPMQTIRDGVVYVCPAAASMQFNAWPDDEDVRQDDAHPPGFNFVHLLDGQTIIHQHLL